MTEPYEPWCHILSYRHEGDTFRVLHQQYAQATLDRISLSVDDRYASTIVAVSGGYPESYEKGKIIIGIDPKDFVVHAGTAIADGELVTSGGRVLSATSFGDDHNQAIAKSYEALAKVAFEGMYYRKDIGFDL